MCCELLSDFVSSFFEHNLHEGLARDCPVVNCFQILYLRSLNTIDIRTIQEAISCELLSDFVSSFFEHNSNALMHSAQRPGTLVAPFLINL